MRAHHPFITTALATVIMMACGFAAGSDETEPAAGQAPNGQTVRDPFWPVGYQPVPVSEQEERTRMADIRSRINWPALPLSGISHAGGTRFIAMIEGVGLVEAGDVVSLRHESLRYRWRIDAITPDGVSSTRLSVTDESTTRPVAPETE